MYTRNQTSALTARQKNIDSSISPAHARRKFSATAAAFQYGRARNDGERLRLWSTARCRRYQRNSGLVKPIFLRRGPTLLGRAAAQGWRAVAPLHASWV